MMSMVVSSRNGVREVWGKKRIEDLNKLPPPSVKIGSGILYAVPWATRSICSAPPLRA